MNVRMQIDEHYQFSVSQEMDDTGLVEVALFCDGHFVPCNAWATNWVGADYDDDVIRKLDAIDVLEALCYAKNYVYIHTEEFIWEQEHV